MKNKITFWGNGGTDAAVSNFCSLQSKLQVLKLAGMLILITVIGFNFTTCKDSDDGTTAATTADNAAITTAKGLVEGAVYTDTQENITTIGNARAKVEAIISGLTLNGVTTEIIDGEFKSAVAGTFENVNGINGSYTFTVKLKKGMGLELEYLRFRKRT